jgi:uncharacterized protein
MADSGRLTPVPIRDLADIIAEFHRDAEIVTGGGGRASIAGTIAINDANLRLAAPSLDCGPIDELRSASHARLEAAGPLLEARRERGSVRRCHGDLHLRNICLFEERPTLFDGIEFNDDFARIDVIYDLAFLLMDLTQRRLDGFANLVFNRYLDRTGDVEGLAAMPLFLSARAAVRAHVLGALARCERDGREAGRAAEQARSYLTLAVALLTPEPPRLIAIGGLSGSGKSTVAQSLAAGLAPAPGARVITVGYTAIVDAAFLRAEERHSSVLERRHDLHETVDDAADGAIACLHALTGWERHARGLRPEGASRP